MAIGSRNSKLASIYATSTTLDTSSSTSLTFPRSSFSWSTLLPKARSVIIRCYCSKFNIFHTLEGKYDPKRRTVEEAERQMCPFILLLLLPLPTSLSFSFTIVTRHSLAFRQLLQRKETSRQRHAFSKTFLSLNQNKSSMKAAIFAKLE
jgi:hypothetical protein